MTGSSSAILTESGTNELEIIEFHLFKQMPDGSQKTCLLQRCQSLQVPETTDLQMLSPHDRCFFIRRINSAEWLAWGSYREELTRKFVIVTDFNI